MQVGSCQTSGCERNCCLLEMFILQSQLFLVIMQLEWRFMRHYRQRGAKHGSSNGDTIESLCCFSVERRPPFTAPIDSGRNFWIYSKSAVGTLLFYSERCRKQCSSSFVSQSSEPNFYSACKWNLCHCSCNRNPLRARGHVSALCYRFTDGWSGCTAICIGTAKETTGCTWCI